MPCSFHANKKSNGILLFIEHDYELIQISNELK